MKVPIVVNENKKLRKVKNYGYDNSYNSKGKSKPGFPKFISYSLLRAKFSHLSELPLRS